MEYGAENLDWNANAGRQLDALARALPPQPGLVITVFGSAPLQLMIARSFLSEDIDVYSAEEHWEFLTRFVENKGWGKGQTDFYIQVCDPYAFKSTFDWETRAINVERHGLRFRFVHPWDVLVSKLQRLEEKDLEAFKLGHRKDWPSHRGRVQAPLAKSRGPVSSEVRRGKPRAAI